MIRQLVPLATSVLTLTGMWLVGNRDARGWTLGLVNQALWLATIILFGTWGLLPLCIALVFTYTRNLLRWRAEEKAGVA